MYLYGDDGSNDESVDFVQIWMHILCCSDTMIEIKGDPKYNELYVSVKEKVKNTLKVMMHRGIFKD